MLTIANANTNPYPSICNVGMGAPYPPCRVEGCGADSSHRSPFCVVHATGGRRCQQQGCSKCAQVQHIHIIIIQF